jgi:hypothetical protein
MFCDDIFIGVVYIASVNVDDTEAGEFAKANEGNARRINGVSGSFLALEKVGQWRLTESVASKWVALQGGPA